MYAALKTRLYQWFSPPRAPEAGPIVLVQRRVYILPTRQGLTFGVVLLMMLLGAINYGLSLGFILTFLLVALAFNTMLYTFRNLAQLQVSAARTQPVFAGEPAQFTLQLFNADRHTRYAIGLSRERRGGSGDAFADVAAGASARISINIPTVQRGRLPVGRLTLFTQSPLGLYHAWSYVHPAVSCVVYPRPAAAGLPLPHSASASGSGAPHGQGQDDFAGLRTYHAGDPPRHIAWKAVARGQGLLTKQFSGNAAREVWLEWDLLPPRMVLEERISRLTRWVLDAHSLRLAYGLRLPGVTVPLGAGDAQRERCLETLALYQVPEQARA